MQHAVHDIIIRRKVLLIIGLPRVIDGKDLLSMTTALSFEKMSGGLCLRFSRALRGLASLCEIVVCQIFISGLEQLCTSTQQHLCILTRVSALTPNTLVVQGGLCLREGLTQIKQFCGCEAGRFFVTLHDQFGGHFSNHNLLLRTGLVKKEFSFAECSVCCMQREQVI